MSNFSFTSTEPVALADNGAVQSFAKTGVATNTEPAPPPFQSYAGIVPFLVNLEVFLNIETASDKAYITVHLTGYGTGQGIQQRILWKGYTDISSLLATVNSEDIWTININPQAPIPANFTLPIPQPSVFTIEDHYDLTDIKVKYWQTPDNVLLDHIGLVICKDTTIPQGSYLVKVVNTTIEAKLMIGARNIIITDPKA